MMPKIKIMFSYFASNSQSLNSYTNVFEDKQLLLQGQGPRPSMVNPTKVDSSDSKWVRLNPRDSRNS